MKVTGNLGVIQLIALTITTTALIQIMVVTRRVVQEFLPDPIYWLLYFALVGPLWRSDDEYHEIYDRSVHYICNDTPCVSCMKSFTFRYR
jgi:hypothetical protein